MGHYASEMAGPELTDRAAEELRRAQERGHAAARWAYYRQQEERGVRISGDLVLTCPGCWAQVRALFLIDHDSQAHS